MHFIISEVFFALKNVSKSVGIGFFLLFLFNLSLFFEKFTLNFFLLPLVSHFRINAAKFGFLLSIFHDLITLHCVGAVVELEEELEEFAVAVLGILGLGKRVDHVASDFANGCIITTLFGWSLRLLCSAFLFNNLSLLKELGWGSVHRAHYSSHHHVVHQPGLRGLHGLCGRLACLSLGRFYRRRAH